MNHAPFEKFVDDNGLVSDEPVLEQRVSERRFVDDDALVSDEPSPLEDVEFIAMLNSRMAHPDKDVPDDVPVYSLAGTPICHKGNISLIESTMKTGKTAFVSAMMAACYPQPGADTLGWSSTNLAGHAVVHVDTEQSRSDHHTVIKRVHKRAGAAIFPSWLRSCAFRGMLIQEMKQGVETLLKKASTELGGVHSLIIDGIGDFVMDVNSAEESHLIVSWLEKLVEEYDMPVITILHLNPVTQKGQGTKARGHLGTHLYRKAEHVLRLDKDKDGITVVSTSFARKAPLPRDSQPCFQFSHEHKRDLSKSLCLRAVDVLMDLLGSLRCGRGSLAEARAELDGELVGGGLPVQRWGFPLFGDV